MSDICQMCHKDTDSNEIDFVNRETGIKMPEDIIVCPPCARKYIIDYKEGIYKPAFEKLFRLVNNMSFDCNGYDSEALRNLFFREHRQLQGNALWFFRKLFNLIGQRSGYSCWEDPRNEAALAWCKKAAEVL